MLQVGVCIFFHKVLFCFFFSLICYIDWFCGFYFFIFMNDLALVALHCGVDIDANVPNVRDTHSR